MSQGKGTPPSEAALLQAVERAGRVGLAAIDRDGRQSYVSPGFCAMVGWSEEELLGATPPFVYWPPEELPAIDRALRLTVSGDVPPGGYELRFMRKNGERFVAQLAIAPLEEPGVGAIGWLASLYEIVEDAAPSRGEPEWTGSHDALLVRRHLYESERAARKEAEAARQRMALLDTITKDLVGKMGYASPVDELIRLLVPALADWCGVYLLGKDGKLEVAALRHVDEHKTAALREVLLKQGLSLDLSWGIPEVLRTGRSQLITDLTNDHLAAAVNAAALPESIAALGMRCCVLVPMRADGRVIGCLTLAQAESGRRFGDDDVVLAEEVGTRAAMMIEQRRLAEEHQAARKEAEAANRAKDVFLAMLGHELRNPLAPISTALELMRMREGDPMRREREVIERQVRHLVRLVDDLLDVARIIQGKVELAPVPLDLAEVLTKAVEMASPLVERQRHRLTLQARPGLLVRGDRARLEQVFSNLVTNAAKYTRAGGRIEVRARCEGDEIVTHVIDDGEGIEPQLLSQIFDLFAQGERTLDRAQGGLGIGLTIVRSMVELHGGRVAAHSDGRGRGSDFVVRLPARVAVEVEALHVPSAAAIRDCPHAVADTRVLIVDDNEDATAMLAEALRGLGYQTRVAHDGPSGLEAAAELDPHIALLDLGLPVMDGYELGRRLKATRAISLVAISGYAQDGDRVRAHEAGFDRHMTKPVDLVQLAGVLDELSRSR